MEYIAELFDEDLTELFRICLTSSYFLWDGEFYEQTDGVAMGSPLSPIIANLFMERFEQRALEKARLKPKVWYRYVDDTFAVWSHGKEELVNFLGHLNGINQNIQFTMELEQEGNLPFLDVLISREGQRLGHKVYRKGTHTDRYLNKLSNHHPSQKRGMMKTLSDRARNICEPQYLREELKHLREAFVANGYTNKEISRALKPNNNVRKPLETSDKIGTAFLHFIPRVTDRIGKLLKKHRIETIYKPTQKLKACLRSAKDSRDPRTSGGVYRIPCSCGQVYIGMTKRSVNTRIQEHRRHCRLQQGEKSAVAEHAIKHLDHDIRFDDTQVLAKTENYYNRLYREAVEIYKHQNCFNKKEEGIKVRKSWYPALKRCKTKPYSSVEVHNANRQNTSQSGASGLHTDQSGNSVDGSQSNDSSIHRHGYKTRSQSKQNVSATRTSSDDTPEDAVHRRQRNVE